MFALGSSVSLVRSDREGPSERRFIPACFGRFKTLVGRCGRFGNARNFVRSGLEQTALGEGRCLTVPYYDVIEDFNVDE